MPFASRQLFISWCWHNFDLNSANYMKRTQKDLNAAAIYFEPHFDHRPEFFSCCLKKIDEQWKFTLVFVRLDESFINKPHGFSRLRCDTILPLKGSVGAFSLFKLSNSRGSSRLSIVWRRLPHSSFDYLFFEKWLVSRLLLMPQARSFSPNIDEIRRAAGVCRRLEH